MPGRTWIVGVIVLGCSGCFTGQGPTAARVRADTNDRYLLQDEIHFVERGQKATGVLVSATAGFDSAFSANWTTKLVPTAPGMLAGPVWTGKKPGREQAVAIAGLPEYRGTFSPTLYGDLVRYRFDERAVWILGTDPFILGLPAGEPQRSWRSFAEMATGVGDATHQLPIKPFVVRYVVAEEFAQPLARLVVFPTDFWDNPPKTFADVKLTLVTLRTPLQINDALETLAAGDPIRLGAAETVGMEILYEDGKARGQREREDREKLLRQ